MVLCTAQSMAHHVPSRLGEVSAIERAVTAGPADERAAVYPTTWHPRVNNDGACAAFMCVGKVFGLSTVD